MENLENKVGVFNKELTDSIQNSIYTSSSGFGPSLIALLLYGPSGIGLDKKFLKINSNIDSENSEVFLKRKNEGYEEEDLYIKNILQEREKLINNNYIESIKPKTREIYSFFTGGIGHYPSKNKEIAYRVRPFEEIRKILKDSYKGTFDLEKDIASELFSNDSINKENKYVKFFYDKGNNFLYSMRTKKTPQCQEKFAIKYDNLLEDKKELFPYFLEQICNDHFYFWENENYKKYEEIYGTNMTELMIGDYFGIKIVDLNDKRGKERQEELATNLSNIKLGNFNHLINRFDDHRKRLLKKKPGGLHFTLTDRGLVNYPIEVQYLSLEDSIRDIFGPHKHTLYSERGKKSNNNY